MCDECHQSPHATMCPNGTPMVDTIYVDCALCGAEVDEETTTYGICEKCWTDAHTIDNAIAYGYSLRGKDILTVNAFYTYMLTPNQIDDALRELVNTMRLFRNDYVRRVSDEFLRDNDGDFADWLKDQKNID